MADPGGVRGGPVEVALLPGELDGIKPMAIQPVTLFGTSDPREVLAKATEIADVLAKVVEKQGLYTVIGKKKHLHVEAWTFLGSMVGLFPKVEWSRKVEDGWEARVVAVYAGSGAIVGAGESECLRAEGTWKSRDDYALRGMAQSRATSRALRGPLGFLAVLAGFAATPAEEMPREPAKRSQRASQGEQPVTTSPAEAAPTTSSEDTGEIGDMKLLYHLASTLPNNPQKAPDIDLLVAEHGYKLIERRLRAAHSLQCHSAKCEHVL